MKFAELMEFYLEACSDRKQVTEHLEELLLNFPEKSVMDCSVGTGFIMLDLIRDGHSIICADGSAAMLERFEINAAELGLDTKPIHLDWADLAGTFPDVFDLLICRGNSLVYANVWDNDNPVADAAAIVGHLKSMYGALKPGGFLYVDIPAHSDQSRPDGRIYHTPCEVRGWKVSVSETITLLADAGLRRWEVRMELDDEVFEFTRHSHVFDETRLRQALDHAGFTEVMPLEGNTLRDHYQVFTARKPFPNVMQRFAPAAQDSADPR
ncbi:class I SAM-dependent methyltransferase [Streptomyces chryseus]|uniref:class I SAM-dependent methyltransferase n=2 Tax=Streptomyces chryseus TaxID=68186 RepID=UPI00110FAD13|nr:class I SAM-dependent methyltransferase [Streptomyces chryseus]